MRRTSLCSLAALATLCLFGTTIPARATIDATLNTTNFVSGQASELSIDGVISSGGTSTSINGASVMIRFDPTKVTLSGIRSGPNGWGLTASNTTSLSEGWAMAILSNSSGDAGEGQTSNGPIMYFTVTPVDSNVNVDDCDTLRFSGSESDLSDQDYYTTIPSEPCTDLARTEGSENTADLPDSPASGTGLLPTDCQPDLPNAILALQVTGGLTESTPNSLPTLDRDIDGVVTLVDVLMFLRPCMQEPLGWYTFQGNSQRTGRLLSAIPDNPTQLWSATLPRANAVWQDPPTLQSTLQPSVIAVPNPSSPASWPVLFAAVNDVQSSVYPGDGNYMASKLYRIDDQGTSGLTPTTGQWIFTNAVGTPSVARGFIATGIMAVTDPVDGILKVIVVGNEYAGITSTSAHCHVYAFDAAHISDGSLWDHRFSGAILCSPAYSPIGTTYQLRPASGPDVGVSNTGGSVLVSYATADNTGSYMLALNVHDGSICWGTVYGYSGEGATAGDLVPNVNGTLGGLPQLSGHATQSSPSRDGVSAYVGDNIGILNVRELATGTVVAGPDFSGTGGLGGNSAQGSPALFEDKVYLNTINAGKLACGIITSGSEGSRDGEFLWRYGDTQYSLFPSYATPAFWREGRTTFLPDLNGDIFGIGSDEDPNNVGHPKVKWSPPRVFTDGNAAVYASPIVTGTPGSSTARVFVATDGGFVNVRDAADGGQAYSSLGPLNGKVRASMAAFKPGNSTARLYVLSMGTEGDPVPRLYCFGGQ